MIIYKATNIINEKNYIGQTIKTLEDRKCGHYDDAFRIKKTTKFHNALRKYGKEKFEWSIVCECSSIEELNEKEKFYIKEFNSFGEMGYNLTDGGLNFIRSEETKKKMSEQRKGRILSDEWRKNLSLAGMGRKISDETKKKMSDVQKGRECTWLKGKKLSKETKRKMSLAQMGNKKGIGNKNRSGKLHSEETKDKMRESCKGINSKPVDRYDLNDNYIDSWKSITEFELSINKLNNTHISDVCLGKRNSSCGYKWKYKII